MSMSSQLVTQAERGVTRQAPPVKTLVELKEIATYCQQSGLLPQQMSPAQAMIVMLKGQELGLRPMQSLGHIYVVHGNAALDTKLMIALYKSAGHSYKVLKRDSKEVTIQFMLADGQEYEHTLTMAEARQAGWDQDFKGTKHTWAKMPLIMLTYRAMATGIRVCAPEVLMGSIIKDEAEDLAGPMGADIIEGESRVIEAEPEPEPEPQADHWALDDELRGQFVVRYKELDLAPDEVLQALTDDCGHPVARLGEYSDHHAAAMAALETFAKAKAEPVAEGLLI